MQELTRLKLSSLIMMSFLSVVLFGFKVQAQEATSVLEQIHSSKEIKVCIWPDYYSISYRDPRTKQLSGIDIDLSKQLAQELQVELKYVDSSFARLIEDLNSENCHVAMFGIGVIPEREDKISFTQPHLVSDVLAVTTRSNRYLQSWEDLDQPGNVLAVAKGTLHEPLMRRNLKHAQLSTPATPHAREQEVLSGRADAFMTDFPYTLRLLATTDWARLIEPPKTYHLTYYAWAVKNGDAQWLAYLNEFMQKIKSNGSLLKAANKHGLGPAVFLE